MCFFIVLLKGVNIKQPVRTLQYKLLLPQFNSQKIMAFPLKSKKNIIVVAKTFERDAIFARLHVILQIWYKSTLNTGFLKLYEKKVKREHSHQS